MLSSLKSLAPSTEVSWYHSFSPICWSFRVFIRNFGTPWQKRVASTSANDGRSLRSWLGSDAKRENLNVWLLLAGSALMDFYLPQPSPHSCGVSTACRLISFPPLSHSSFETICLWLKAQLFLKCSVSSKIVFWIPHRKTSRIFPFHFFSPSPFSAVKAGYNTFLILLLPIISAPWSQLGSRPLAVFSLLLSSLLTNRPPMVGEFGY